MKILIVEDDAEIRAILAATLKEACFAVDTAESGETGSYMARTNDYDLIILDNILPKKHGIEVCQELRAAEITTPILMLSVRSEVTTKAKLLDAGADDYLTKPYSVEELLARVRALLRRPKKSDSDILQLDNLTVNLQKHQVTRGNQEIQLTRKEFILLSYFMKNIDVVLSRGMITEHVWDMNADPFSNTIEAHIRSLRKKIDEKFGKELIHTVPGFGYKMSIKK